MILTFLAGFATLRPLLITTMPNLDSSEEMVDSLDFDVFFSYTTGFFWHTPRVELVNHLFLECLHQKP